MEVSLLLEYWKGVLKDRKFLYLLIIGGVLGGISGVTGSLLPLLLGGIIGKGYGVLVVSLVWYAQRGEVEFSKKLHSIPFSALKTPKIWEVAFGVIVGEIGVGIGGGILLYLFGALLGELGTIVGFLLLLYFLLGREGGAYAANSFKEALLYLISLFWDFQYWKRSFNPTYSSLYFILIFFWVWLVIGISLIGSILPPLLPVLNGMGAIIISTLFPIGGYLADESVKILEEF